MNASVFLADLSDKLGAIKRRNLATQAQIYEFTGVDQATISRVLNGERRRVNESLLRLDEYVNMLLQDGELSKDIQQAAQKFLSRGGTEVELIASIEQSSKLVLGRRKTWKRTDDIV